MGRGHPKSIDVVVVGGTGIDTNVYLPGGDIDFVHEANFTENLDCVGQAGGYSARGFLRMGLTTSIIDALGDDVYSGLIRKTLKNDGISSPVFLEDPKGTRRSVNIMYRDGRRKNFYDGKGSMEIREADLPLRRISTAFQKTKLAHFSVVNWARYLLKPAKAAGVTISVDLQDAPSVDDPYRAEFVREADVIFFSSVNAVDLQSFFEGYVKDRPDRIVVCGMGEKGCAVGSAGGIDYFPAVHDDRAVVDTNGAGDSLAVGFLTGRYFERRSLAESALCGQIAARHACTLRGTSDGLLSRGELRRRLSKVTE
jgi:sugar/nucleoside kinase (ribokinase family)